MKIQSMLCESACTVGEEGRCDCVASDVECMMDVFVVVSCLD
jgi:hypothetical protein